MDFFDFVIKPFAKSSKPDRKWKCRGSGHVVLAPDMPDICPECRKTVGGLWLSMFDKIVD